MQHDASSLSRVTQRAEITAISKKFRYFVRSFETSRLAMRPRTSGCQSGARAACKQPGQQGQYRAARTGRGPLHPASRLRRPDGHDQSVVWPADSIHQGGVVTLSDTRLTTAAVARTAEVACILTGGLDPLRILEFVSEGHEWASILDACQVSQSEAPNSSGDADGELPPLRRGCGVSREASSSPSSAAATACGCRAQRMAVKGASETTYHGGLGTTAHREREQRSLSVHSRYARRCRPS